MSILEHKSFIQAIAPFDHLLDEELETVANSVDISYYKADTVLLHPNLAPSNLYIIIKGLVHETNSDGELVSIYARQDSFDPIALIENKTKNTFTAQQELICYTLPKTVFLDLIEANKTFQNAYYQSLSSRLEHLIEQRNSKELAAFMTAKIQDTYMHPPLFVDAEISIFNAVEKMHAHKGSSMLVRRGDEIGIVTDTDIRNNVVLKRIPIDEQIGKIATFDLVSVKQSDFLFNALLKMTRYSLKRLVVCDDNGKSAVGVLDQIDVLSYLSNHSRLVAVQVERATSVDQLEKASQNLIDMVQALYAKGTKIRYICQFVSELNRKIFEKLYALLAPEELLENTCLIIMGSEGRGEQILKTDQDNAIILRDGFEFDGLAAMTQQFTDTLIHCGYPPCPGNIMVSNPFWCKPLQEYKNNIYQWVDQPNEENLMNLAIFYDATVVAGNADLLNQAKTYLFDKLIDNAPFYSHFARPTLAFETPLSMFANFIVDKSHKNELDIKKGGIFPIVQGARSLALEARLTQTNTIERIKALRDLGIFDKEFAVELIETFAFLLSLRLHFGLEEVNMQEKTDNYINPNKLNKLERDLLKDAFRIVNEFKKRISFHFKLNMGV